MHLLLTNESHTVFPTVEAAEAVAAENARDDDWEYRVIPDPNGSGRAIIKIYDESGEFVSNL